MTVGLGVRCRYGRLVSDGCADEACGCTSVVRGCVSCGGDGGGRYVIIGCESCD